MPLVHWVRFAYLVSPGVAHLVSPGGAAAVAALAKALALASDSLVPESGTGFRELVHVVLSCALVLSIQSRAVLAALAPR